MDFLRAIANDFLNGFSANDIPVFLSRIFFSGIIALLIKFLYKRKYKTEHTSIINHSVLLSITIAIVVPVAQFSISLGIIMAALIVAFILSFKVENYKEQIFVLVTLLLSSSIGAGYVIYTIIGAIIVLTYILISKD